MYLGVRTRSVVVICEMAFMCACACVHVFTSVLCVCVCGIEWGNITSRLPPSPSASSAYKGQTT